MPRSATTGIFARVSNSFSNPVFGTLIDPNDAIIYFNDLDAGLNPPELPSHRVINALTVGTAGSAAGTIDFLNATSGAITLSPPAGALGTPTLTLPAATDTLVGKATTDALSNKTYNKVTITPPATSATLTLIDGTVLTGPATSGTVLISSAIGVTIQAFDAQLFSNLPQNSQSTAYTTVATDAAKHILHPSSDNNARTFTIAANASVPYVIGTPITFVNKINTVTIAINSDTLTLAGTGTTGSRTLAANGIATAVKIAATEWIISGAGLT